MALQDFNTSRDHAVGDVLSRKNIENLTVSEDIWIQLIGAADGFFPVDEILGTEEEEGFTNEELKCVIKLYDQQIADEEFFGHELGSDEASQVKSVREDLVDVLKDRKE